MPISVYVAALGVASALPLLWWGVSGTRVSKIGRSRLGDRVTDLRALTLERSASQRIGRPMLDGVAAGLRRLTPQGVVERVEKRVGLAGLGDAWPVERVLGLKLGLTVVLGIIGALRAAANPTPSSLVVAIVLAMVGYIAPDVWLSGRADRAQTEIRTSLPDLLDQITICVDAGLGFEAAMARVAEVNEGRLASEFRRMLQEVRVGVSRQHAFESLVARTDVDDLRYFISAVSQAERLGVPIADVLRVQAAEMRLKRRQWAEEAAQKLPVKLLFPLIFVILPALFIVMLGPAVIDLIDTFSEIDG